MAGEDLHGGNCWCYKCKPRTAPTVSGEEITRWVQEAVRGQRGPEPEMGWHTWPEAGWVVNLEGALAQREINVEGPGTYTIVLYIGSPAPDQAVSGEPVAKESVLLAALQKIVRKVPPPTLVGTIASDALVQHKALASPEPTEDGQ